MKNTFLFLLLNSVVMTFANAQETTITDKQHQDIYSLIAKYVEAREKLDTVLLKSILTNDVDQLVSSGTWRHGKNESMEGMMRSSESNPGNRKIIIEKIRLFNSESGIVDTRYEIENIDGTVRKMWSTFVVVYIEEMWRITAIRNMLPTRTK